MTQPVITLSCGHIVDKNQKPRPRYPAGRRDVGNSADCYFCRICGFVRPVSSPIAPPDNGVQLNSPALVRLLGHLENARHTYERMGRDNILDINSSAGRAMYDLMASEVKNATELYDYFAEILDKRQEKEI